MSQNKCISIAASLEAIITTSIEVTSPKDCATQPAERGLGFRV